MRTLVGSVAIVFLAAPVCGDSLYKLVGYECDSKTNRVILSYAGGFNEAGKMMKAKKGPRQWDPWSLIEKTKGDRIQSLKTVGGQCALADGSYEIRIGALPGNANLQGMCGGFMSAWAEVKRGAETALPRTPFESPDCHNPETGVTVEIVIEAGREPVFTRISREEFYQRAGGAPARKD